MSHLDAILSRLAAFHAACDSAEPDDNTFFAAVKVAEDAIREHDVPGFRELLDWAYDAPESMGDFSTFHGCPDLTAELSTLFQIAAL